jgi:hypothetical protein
MLDRKAQFQKNVCLKLTSKLRTIQIIITLIEGHSYFVPETPPNSCITGPKPPQKKSEKGVELIALSQFWDFF